MSTSLSKQTVAPQADREGELSHKQIMSILWGLMIAMFLAALDQTVVNTAIRTIGDDLHGLSVQAWVTTAFLITTTIATPLFGKISDLYGRKPMFMIAIVIFLAGSVLCGIATSMYELAAFRALQGVGAGGIIPLALAIIGDIIPPRERARYQAYYMTVFGATSVLGPVLGGFFAGASTILGIAGWRWIFFINVPVGIVAMVVLTRVLKLEHTRRDHRIDWGGAAALSLGLVPLLVIAEQGREWGWLSAGAWVCYVLGAVGLVGFGVVENRMGDDALLPVRLFRDRTFFVGSLQSVAIGAAMFGVSAAVPLYFQIVKGASPTKAGLLLVPMVLGLMISSQAAGRVTSRTGKYKVFPVVGSALMVVGMLLLALVGPDTPLVQTELISFLLGFGLGLNMQTIVLAMQNAVPARDMGVATSSVTFFRQVGGSLGTAVLLSILFTRAGSEIPHQLAKAGIAPDRVGGVDLNDTSGLAALPTAVRHPILVGFADGIDLVFLVAAVVAVLAVITSALIKEIPLRTMSGQRALAAEAAAAAASTTPTTSPTTAAPVADDLDEARR